MNDGIDAVPNAIRKSRSDLEGQLSSSISELKRKVHTVQEKTSHELAQKLSRSTYQFKRKGNEVQYTFNSGVEEAISAARQELRKVKPSVAEQKEALKKADNFLDEV